MYKRQIFRGWAAARPSPSHFQKLSARPGPAHHFIKRLGPARSGSSHGSEAHEIQALYRPARQLREPARGFDGPAHVLSRTIRCMCIRRRDFFTLIVVFVVFSHLDFVGQLLSAHETHITSTHYSHNYAPSTTRSDGFMWATTSSCCCNARGGSSSNSSSTCRCTTRCCCNTRCCNTLYRAKITPVQAVTLWWRLPTLQQQQSSSPVRHTHMKVNVAATFGQKMSPV